MENTDSDLNNDDWECSVCTLLNNNQSTECVACGTSRDGNLENTTAVWTCEYCTTFNQMSTDICISCGLPMNSNIQNTNNSEPQMTETEALSILGELFGFNMRSMENMSEREEAEYIAYQGRSCRCNVCKLRAIRNIIGLNQTASTDRQKRLAGIMMNEILPSLIISTFNADNPILQMLSSGNMTSLEEVLDRSLAEAEGNMIPANEKELECLKCIDYSKDCLEKYHNQSSCVICMDEFNSKENTQICEMPCGHIFHKSCIKKWLSESDASCPICKHRINQKLDIVKDTNQDNHLNSNSDENQDLI